MRDNLSNVDGLSQTISVYAHLESNSFPYLLDLISKIRKLR